jgi:membrane protein required for colicin V production
MNMTDILIIVCLLGFMILGFRDGFLKKVFGVLGFWAGFVLGIKFMLPLGQKYTEWLSFAEDTSLVVAFLTIFVLTGLIVNFSYRWYGRSSSESLKPVSRVAGALIGGFQGLLAASLMLLMFNAFDIPSDESRNNSLFYTDVAGITPSVFDYSTQWIPESKTFFEELNGKLKISKITQ